MDAKSYDSFLEKKSLEWESICSRCGACCGVVDGDMCSNLFKDDLDRYSCKIYSDRFGVHDTVNGKRIRCVPIRDIMNTDWPGKERCMYNVSFK